MAEPLEQKVDVPNQEKTAEKKPAGTLESVVNETIDAIKAGFNLGIGVAAPAAGYALTGNLGVPIVSAAFVAGTKGKKSSKTIMKESLSGALFGTFAHYTTLPLKYLSKIGKLAYMIPWVFGANAFYMAEDHLIKEKSPNGLYKKFKESYWPTVKKAFKLPATLNILSALFLPQKYMVGAVAVANFLFRRFVVGGKGEEETDKTPYSVAASNVTGRLLRNTTKGLYDTAYGIGSGFRNLYDSGKRAAPVTPVPAAIPAP